MLCLMKTLQFCEPTTGEGRFIRQMSSRDSYGHVVLSIEATASSDLQFSWEVDENEIPREYFSPVREGIVGWLEREDMACVSTVVRVTGGSFNKTDSSANSYKKAAFLAFHDAVRKAGTVCAA